MKNRFIGKSTAVISSAVLAVLAGCGNSIAVTDTASTTSDSVVSIEESESPTSNAPDDNTLTFSFSDEISNIDIIHAYAVENDIITTAIAEQLFYYGPDSSIQKGLVETEEQPADNVYVYNIKENVKFSDGTPLTADDVVYSLERQRDPEVAGELSWMFENVDTIEKTGDYQVTVTLKQPDATWQYTMATTASLVISKAYAEEHAENLGTADGGLVGSGPYVIESWDQGSEIVLTKNENYWDDSLSLDFDKVDFKFIPDASVAKLSLESGEIDFTTAITADSAYELESNDNVNVQAVDYFGETFLSFNNSREPFNDKNVRKAIAYAVDKQSLVDNVYYGLYAGKANALPHGESIITTAKEEWTDYLANVETYDLDLDKAKEYLAQSSVPDGFTAKLVYPASDPVYESVALVIQQNLKELNINLELEGLASSEISTLRYGGSETRDYDLMIARWGSDYPDPIGVISPLFLSTNNVAGGSNWSEYNSEEFDKLIGEQAKELDSVKRAAILQDALSVLADDIPSYPIYYHYRLFATSSRINYEITPSCLYNIFVKDIKKAN
ncbi:MAG: ABC transporter substrate-binding protein [Butyrivibrio sp.]|nr:ABC transporter substrate-binding protein [Butyrivibrio sp.]